MSETTMTDPIYAIFFLIIGIPIAINIVIRIRRYCTVNAAVEGCLACGSLDTVTAGMQVCCSTCGYAGRADRGGKMSFKEAGVSVGNVERKAIDLFRRGI